MPAGKDSDYLTTDGDDGLRWGRLFWVQKGRAWGTRPFEMGFGFGDFDSGEIG